MQPAGLPTAAERKGCFLLRLLSREERQLLRPAGDEGTVRIKVTKSSIQLYILEFDELCESPLPGERVARRAGCGDLPPSVTAYAVTASLQGAAFGAPAPVRQT